MGIVSKIQHWFKVILTGFSHPGDKSQHRIHTVTEKNFRYEDLCM